MYKASIALVCTYDSDADAAYLCLEHPIPPGAAKKVTTFDTDRGMFNLDFNANRQVLGLENPWRPHASTTRSPPGDTGPQPSSDHEPMIV